MIAADTNILVYAHRKELPLDAVALRRVTELAEGPSLWALPVFCPGEIVRIVTHPAVLRPPSLLEEGLHAPEGLAGGEVPGRFGDVAMLFRDMGDVLLYEEAPVRYDIPYRVRSRRTFYRREVGRPLNVLHAVEHLTGSIALGTCCARRPSVDRTGRCRSWWYPAARLTTRLASRGGCSWRG